MSCRESVKATVKVTLTDPDGKVLKVVEGEAPDPFNVTLIDILTWNLYGPQTWAELQDPFGNWYTFDFVTPSPSTSLGYLIPSFCLTNCPNAGITPPNGPGIWLFNSPLLGGLTSFGTAPWSIYMNTYLSSPNLITGLSYSSLSINGGTSTPVNPGDVVVEYFYITQSITNTLSSPVYIYTMMLVGVFYGTLSASPIYAPITFYMFSPPIVLSPGVTMTVTVALGFPYAIAYPTT
jgi:hypothetical protein